MKPRAMLVIGAILYAISWFLPVMGAGLKSSGRFMAWDAFVAALWPFEGSDEPWYGALHFVASALSNFLLVGALVLVLVARRGPSRLLRWLVAASALLNTHWFLFTFGSDRTDLRIGYYLWAISFFVVAAGLTLEARRSEPGQPQTAG